VKKGEKAKGYRLEAKGRKDEKWRRDIGYRPCSEKTLKMPGFGFPLPLRERARVRGMKEAGSLIG